MKNHILFFTNFAALISLLFSFSGCTAVYSSVRPKAKEEILAGSQGESLIGQEPYKEAHKKEALVEFRLELPGFPNWRRYYWTDKALWGNRGYVLGGPKAEYMVKPEAVPTFGNYEKILEDLRLKLTMTEQPQDQMVIIEEPIYDRRRAFEESKLAEKAGLVTAHKVKKGESLWLIAGYQEIYGNPLEWPEIFQANRDRVLDPNLIYPDQDLRIPRDLNSVQRDTQSYIK